MPVIKPLCNTSILYYSKKRLTQKREIHHVILEHGFLNPETEKLLNIDGLFSPSIYPFQRY